MRQTRLPDFPLTRGPELKSPLWGTNADWMFGTTSYKGIKVTLEFAFLIRYARGTAHFAVLYRLR